MQVNVRRESDICHPKALANSLTWDKFFHEAVRVLEGVRHPPVDCLTAAKELEQELLP
jgi:hypothetical protein